MSALVVTVILTTLIMITTMAVAVALMRCSGTRESNWYRWCDEQDALTYTAKKPVIHDKDIQELDIIFQSQIRFVLNHIKHNNARSTELSTEELGVKRVTTSASSRSKIKNTQPSNTKSDKNMQSRHIEYENCSAWAYFECSVIQYSRLLTSSVILMPCTMRNTQIWIINPISDSHSDAFDHHSSYTTHQRSELIQLNLNDSLSACDLFVDKPHVLEKKFNKKEVIDWFLAHENLTLEWHNGILCAYRCGVLLEPVQLKEALVRLQILIKYIEDR